MTYEAVLELFPSGLGLRQEAETHRLCIPSPPEHFVPPPLRWDGPDQLKDCQVVLFTAAGAVGKSTLAKKLAADRNIHLWNLATTQLGDNSFTGTLVNAFGDGFSNAQRLLAKGGACIILDGLDEAEAGSGWDALESFLREFAGKIRSSLRPAIALFSRIPTAAMAKLILEDAGIRVGNVSIEYFDRDAAVEFISLRLDRQGVRTHRQQPAAFGSLVNHLFEELARSIAYEDAHGAPWEQPEVRSFLGYAPVLEAISALVAGITNYGERPSLSNGQSGQYVVAQIMGSLLDRESSKLVAALQSSGVISEAEGEGLFGSDEQLQLIAASVYAGTPESIPPPSILRPQQAEGYLMARREFLPTHPFLHDKGFAGPAFRDYLLAHMLLGPPDAEKMAADLIESDNFRLTSLFLDFYVDRAQSADAKGAMPSRCRPHVGYLWEADRAAVSRGQTASQQIVTSAGGGVEWLAARTEKLLAFDAGGDPVRLPFSFSSCFVDVDCPLRIGQRGRPIRIADSYVECDELEFDCSQLEIECTPNKLGVVITSRNTPRYQQAMQVRRYDNGEPIVLTWPDASKWPFQGVEPVEPILGQNQAGAVLQIIYRFVSVFRADGYQREYRKNIDLIRNRKASTPLAKQVLNILESIGFFSVVGSFYQLDPDELAKYGMTWANIRGNIYPDAAIDLATAVCERLL